MATAVHEMEPVAPASDEEPGIQELSRHLAGDGMAVLVAPDGTQLEVPASVFSVLRRVVEQMARGNAVSVVPVHMLLTTQQAADLLNVSRPYLIRRLEANEIPYELVGTHRRLRFTDVMDYSQRRALQRRRALAALTAESQDSDVPY